MSPQRVRDMESQPLSAAAQVGYESVATLETGPKKERSLRKTVAVAAGALLIVCALAGVAFVGGPEVAQEASPEDVNIAAYRRKPFVQDGNAWKTSSIQECMGDCDNDSQCLGGADFRCWQRDNHESVPGCGPLTSSIHYNWDFCYNIKIAGIQIGNYPGSNSWTPWSSYYPLPECVGECDSNSDCQGSMQCFQRSHNEVIPGCIGASSGDFDYCYRTSSEHTTKASRAKNYIPVLIGNSGEFRNRDDARIGCKAAGYIGLCSTSEMSGRSITGWTSSNSPGHNRAHCCGETSCDIDLHKGATLTGSSECTAGRNVKNGQTCAFSAKPYWSCSFTGGASSTTCYHGQFTKTTFTCTGGPWGCTDSSACNYDSNAERNDGSCFYNYASDLYNCGSNANSFTCKQGGGAGGTGTCTKFVSNQIRYFASNSATRSNADSYCKSQGYSGLCTATEGVGFKSCAHGYYSDHKGYWYFKNGDGCSGGLQSSSNSRVGAYCCHENQCPTINQAAGSGRNHAYCTGGSATGTHRCTFTCENGYSGGGTITCGKNGNWPTYPTCTVNRCAATTFNFHTNAPVASCGAINAVPSNAARCNLPDCNPGYRREGQTYLQCKLDGTWDKTVRPECKPKYCNAFSIARSWIGHGEWMHRAGGACAQAGAWLNKECTALTGCNSGYVLSSRAHEDILLLGNTATRASKGNLLKSSLTTSKEFILAFDLYVEKVNPGWTNFLAFQAAGLNGHQEWRLPSMFMAKDNKSGLHVTMARAGAWNDNCNTENLPLKTWVNVRVALIGDTIKTYFNGEEKCSRSTFGGNERYGPKEVKVWMSKADQQASDVQLKNIHYIRVTSTKSVCQPDTKWASQLGGSSVVATPMCTDKDECAGGHQCKNGARCENTAGGYKCHCDQGKSIDYHGTHCNSKHQDCHTDKTKLAEQCGVQGTCANLVRTQVGKAHYRCDCNAGFTKMPGATGNMDPCTKTVACQDVDPNSSPTGQPGKCVCNKGYEGTMTATTTAPFYTGKCTPIKCDVPIIRGVKSYKSDKRSSCPTGVRSAAYHETCTIEPYRGFVCRSPAKCLPGAFQNTARCVENQCPRVVVNAEGKTAGTKGACAGGPASVLSPRKTCTFHCEDGYDMVGKAELTCGPSGKWGTEAGVGETHGKWGPDSYPTCTERFCPKLASTASLKTAGYTCPRTGAVNGKACSNFKCQDGFSLSPLSPTRLTCGLDGRWSKTPSCVLTRQCPKIYVNSKSTVASCAGGSPFSKHSCTFYCKPGHELTGKATIRCNEDTLGKWETRPVCVERTCPEIKVGASKDKTVALANCAASLVTSGPTCTFSCQQHYALPLGVAKTISCDLMGKWQTRPKCEHTEALTPPFKWGGNDWKGEEYNIGLTDKSGFVISVKGTGDVEIQMNGQDYSTKLRGSSDQRKCPGYPCASIAASPAQDIPDMYLAFVSAAKAGGAWVPGTKGKLIVRTYKGDALMNTGRTVKALSNKKLTRVQETPITLPTNQVVTVEQVKAALEQTQIDTAAQKAETKASTTASLTFRKGQANKSQLTAYFRANVCKTYTDKDKCMSTVKVTVRSDADSDIVVVKFDGVPNLAPAARPAGEDAPPAVPVLKDLVKDMSPKPSEVSQTNVVTFKTTTTVEPGQVLPEEVTPAQINKNIVGAFERAGGATPFKVKTKPAQVDTATMKVRKQTLSFDLPDPKLTPAQVNAIVGAAAATTGADDEQVVVANDVTFDAVAPIAASVRNDLRTQAAKQLCANFVDKDACQKATTITVVTKNRQFSNASPGWKQNFVCDGTKLSVTDDLKKQDCAARCAAKHGTEYSCCQFFAKEKGGGDRTLTDMGQCTVTNGVAVRWNHYNARQVSSFKLVKKSAVKVQAKGTPVSKQSLEKADKKLLRLQVLVTDATKRFQLAQQKLQAATDAKDAVLVEEATKQVAATKQLVQEQMAALQKATVWKTQVVAANAAQPTNEAKGLGVFKANGAGGLSATLYDQLTSSGDGNLVVRPTQKFKVDVVCTTAKAKLAPEKTCAQTDTDIAAAFGASGGDKTALTVNTRPAKTSLANPKRREQHIEVSGLGVGTTKKQLKAMYDKAKSSTAADTLRMAVHVSVDLKFPKNKTPSRILLISAVGKYCKGFSNAAMCADKDKIKLSYKTVGGFTVVTATVVGFEDAQSGLDGPGPILKQTVSTTDLPDLVATPSPKVAVTMTSVAVATLPTVATPAKMTEQLVDKLKQDRRAFSPSTLPAPAVKAPVETPKTVFQEKTTIPIALPSPLTDAITKNQFEAMYKQAQASTQGGRQSMVAKSTIDLVYNKIEAKDEKDMKAKITKDIEQACSHMADPGHCKASIKITFTPCASGKWTKVTVTMAGEPRRGPSNEAAVGVITKKFMQNAPPAKTPQMKVVVEITSVAMAPNKGTLPLAGGTEKQIATINAAVVGAYTKNGGVIGGLVPAVKPPAVIATPIFKGWMITPGAFKENGPTLMSSIKGKGTVASPAFVVKQNTLSFMTGYGSVNNPTGSTVSLYTNYLQPDQKLIHRHVPNGETRKYEVFWDMTGQLNEMVFLVISDGDDNSAIYFGDMRQFDNTPGCLPDVVQIKANQLCNKVKRSGKCYKLMDQLYEPVRLPTKQTPSGLYCRSGQKGLGENAGSRIQYPKGSKVSTVNLDIGTLPPCVYIEALNDHSYAIKTTNHGRRYLFDMLHNDKGVKAPDMFSVYATKTPRCAETYGALRLTSRFKASCMARRAVENCVGAYFDQFCNDGKKLCGEGKIAQDVLKCCDGNANQAGSACTGSNRRRLGSSMRITTAGATRTVEGLAVSACADKCMKLTDGGPHARESCVAFRVDWHEDKLTGKKKSTCWLATDCFSRKEDVESHQLKKEEWFGFYRPEQGRVANPATYSDSVNPFRGRPGTIKKRHKN